MPVVAGFQGVDSAGNVTTLGRGGSDTSAVALAAALKAAEELASFGLSTTVADARFAKPLDTDLVLRLAAEHEVLITIEEGAIGGFAAQVFALNA